MAAGYKREVDLKELEAICESYKDVDGALVPLLHEVMVLYGWIPPEAAKFLGDYLRLSENHVYAVATFYNDFKTKPPARVNIVICDGPACRITGSQRLIEEAEKLTGIEPGRDDANGEYSLEISPCLGICTHTLAAMVNHRFIGRLKSEDAAKLIEESSVATH